MGVCFSSSKVKGSKKILSHLPLPQASLNETGTVQPTDQIETSEKTDRKQEVKQFNWKRGELIGEGAYGKVYACLNVDTGEIMVDKHVKLSGERSQIEREVLNLKREIGTLRGLSHRNIVRYLHTEVSADGTGVDIFLEYVPGGSVRSLLTKFKKFEEPVVRRYTEHLLRGLEYLHAQGIVHRDIKCANLLVDHDGTVLLSDFGAAKKLTSTEIGEEPSQCKSLRGSPYWMAPEVTRRIGHSYSADIWSVGCSVIEMLTGSPPWSEYSRNVKDVLKLISECTRPPNFPAGISTACKGFLSRCLMLEPASRASAAELLEHPFIKGVSMLEEDVIAKETLDSREDLLFPLDGESMIMDDDKNPALINCSPSELREPARQPSGQDILQLRSLSHFREGKKESLPYYQAEQSEDSSRELIDPNGKVAETRLARRLRLEKEAREREKKAVERAKREAWERELKLESELRLELFFPGRILYHLICFSLSYPNSNAYRKFIVCGLLSFGDFLFTTAVLGEKLPSIAKIFVLQYLVLFIFVHNLKLKQVHDEFKNGYYRNCVFLCEAYVKSTSLASVVHYVLGASFDKERFVLAQGLVMLKSSVTPLIYFADCFFCGSSPFAEVSTKEIKSHLLLGLVVGPVLISSAVLSGEVSDDFYFISGWTLPKGISNAFFLLLYVIQSKKYSRYFK